MDEASQRYGISVLQALRKKEVAAEIYPDTNKLKKQLEYANRKMIPFVVVIGSEEMSSGLLTLKNMETGDQKKVTLEQLVNHPF